MSDKKKPEVFSGFRVMTATELAANSNNQILSSTRCTIDVGCTSCIIAFCHNVTLKNCKDLYVANMHNIVIEDGVSRPAPPIEERAGEWQQH